MDKEVDILKTVDIDELKSIARNVRIGIVEQVFNGKSGHPGGSLSCADILTALYFNQMNINPNEPHAEGRDRFVLSKGHASPALYSTLAERGFFDKKELKTFRSIEGMLQGHPDMNKVPGVDATTGSLGQGLSIANGMALTSKLGKEGFRVYCLLGDGELQEGQVWEAAMSAAHYKLDNLCVIVDNNNLQIDGEVGKVMNPYPIDEKFRSFGFEVVTIDGHDFKDILEAFSVARKTKGKPFAIIAKTVKGKGVSYMENQASWHGKAPDEEQYNVAMKELKGE
jgi:transketolase